MTNQEIIRSIDTLNALIRNFSTIQGSGTVDCSIAIDKAMSKISELIYKIDVDKP